MDKTEEEAQEDRDIEKALSNNKERVALLEETRYPDKDREHRRIVVYWRARLDGALLASTQAMVYFVRRERSLKEENRTFREMLGLPTREE